VESLCEIREGSKSETVKGYWLCQVVKYGIEYVTKKPPETPTNQLELLFE